MNDKQLKKVAKYLAITLWSLAAIFAVGMMWAIFVWMNNA